MQTTPRAGTCPCLVIAAPRAQALQQFSMPSHAPTSWPLVSSFSCYLVWLILSRVRTAQWKASRTPLWCIDPCRGAGAAAHVPKVVSVEVPLCSLCAKSSRWESRRASPVNEDVHCGHACKPGLGTKLTSQVLHGWGPSVFVSSMKRRINDLSSKVQSRLVREGSIFY